MIIPKEVIMKNYDLITPEGTKDLLFGECIVRRNIESSLMGLFRSRGYSETITPGLEFYDVFNLNSRYFPQENLYKLTDTLFGGIPCDLVFNSVGVSGNAL